jgi:predicted O-methyltransferase YrrM
MSYRAAQRVMLGRMIIGKLARALSRTRWSAISPARPRTTEAALSAFATETLAEELAGRLAEMPGNPLHELFYRRGFHLLRKHFYLPIPDDSDRLDDFWEKPSAMAGIDTNDRAALDFMEQLLPPYLAEFRARFPLHRRTLTTGFYLINGGYMAVDAHVYYGLIRHFKPRRIVEIGNGNSTLLALAAAQSNRAAGHETRLVSIDPEPWERFRGGLPGLELIVERVQDVPLELFAELGDGDILFIDSSHVIRSGNDVHYEYLELLPRLRPGVLVHIHDISLPMPYPRTYYDSQRYWNEQYLLQAFLAFNRNFEVIWPGSYLMLTYPDKMHAVFPESSVMRQSYPNAEPTAFWMRTIRP